MTKLQELMHQVELAEDALLKELERVYPKGTELRVQLQSNHVRPSHVVVINQSGGRYGYLRVRLLNGDHTTTVAQSQIVGRA